MKIVNFNNLTQLNALFLITHFYYNHLEILNFNNSQNLLNQAIYCTVIIFSWFLSFIRTHFFSYSPPPCILSMKELVF